MKIVEVERKYFFAGDGTAELLEAYTDPSNELNITFNQSSQNPEVFYGFVNEKSTGLNVVEIVFTLNSQGVIDVGNIIPNTQLGHNKKVFTSQGEQNNGVDIGLTGLRWIKEKIKQYALSKGYDIKKITTSTRYTGARAKNNSNDPNDTASIKQFDISKTFRESITLDFNTGKITKDQK